MKALKFFISCIFMGIFAISQCFAEDKTVYRLGTVVVEETSGVKDIAMINTVTAEEILAMGANNVAEALKFTPGVHFSYKNRGYQPVIMQGIGQDKILLLIDGLPVVPGGGELDLNSIPASIISKIEVVKGASSVLYGPNTMGGVINIITKQGAQGTHGQIRAEVGENGYNHESASLSHGAEKFTGILLVDHTSRDNYELSDDFTPKEPEYAAIEDGDKRQNSKFESINLFSRLGYKYNDDTDLFLNAFSFQVDREVPPNTETTNPFMRRVDDYQVLGASLTAKKEVDDWLTLRGVAFTQKRSQTIKEYNDIALTDLKRDLPDESYIFGFDFFSDMRLADWNMFSFATHLKSENLTEDKKPVTGTFTSKEASAYTMSFALEDTIRFNSFTLVGGLSYHSRKLENVEASDGSTGSGSWKDAIDPMIGISYIFSDGTRMYASLAQKTTYPSIGSTWDSVSANVYDLDPEKDVVCTLGASRIFFDELDTSLAIFHHDIKDKLASDPNAPANVYIPINAGTLRIYGAETALSYNFNNRLTSGIDYSLTKGEGSVAKESEYGDTLTRHLFGFNTSYCIPYIEANLNVYGRYTVDNYDDYGRGSNLPREDRKTFDMDLSLSKLFDNNIEVIARVKNLFDKNIEYEAGQPLEGRTFRLSVAYSF
ncbi:MAG: TonB-dependent receptor [Desulfobacteraceae bacterium]|nr:TonB-dependent receptor [Desulfobacteraceae bacterium]